MYRTWAMYGTCMGHGTVMSADENNVAHTHQFGEKQNSRTGTLRQAADFNKEFDIPI
jgi:hypothetical protein